MDYYKQIFKRKSFHFFKDIEVLTETDIKELKNFIETLKPLYNDIKFEISIVPEFETTCKRGGQYCILFYSETHGEYLRNIGYIGEQIDLYLSSKKYWCIMVWNWKTSKFKTKLFRLCHYDINC